MVGALVVLYEIGQLLSRYIVVIGDSKTILKIVTQDNKVKKAELLAMVWEVRELVKELRAIRVLFKHVLGAKNKITDWLAQVAWNLLGN